MKKQREELLRRAFVAACQSSPSGHGTDNQFGIPAVFQKRLIEFSHYI